MALDSYPMGVYDLSMKQIKDEHKSRLIRRLRILEGQIRGLQEMVEKDTYCIDVITQTSAVKQGLSNLEDLLLENHLGSCILKQVRSGKMDQATAEILKVYKLKRR
jgi:DNA-binding FrmR family transcriptional regulator